MRIGIDDDDGVADGDGNYDIYDDKDNGDDANLHTTN